MSRTLIIAEAGVNHNGSLESAYKLVDVASDAGADYVKFQTFKADMLVDQNTPLAEYQAKNVGENKGQYEMLKSLELDFESFTKIKAHCKDRNIGFASTAFDVVSLESVLQLGVDFLKIPSGEINNYFLLKAIAETGIRTIMSTGMATMDEIREAIDTLTAYGLDKESLTVLHCNTEYPTPMEDVNLLAMITMAKELQVSTGYSDHTLGTSVPIAATALGATVIEKHFTLDQTMKGPDHKASLDPKALKEMVRSIREVEQALGSANKTVTPSEHKNRSAARKSLFFARNMKAGEILKEVDLVALRPGSYLSPMFTPELVGKKLVKDVQKGDIVEQEIIDND